MTRNEVCRCGSGLKYKHCHEPIDLATPENKVIVAQKQYSKLWKRNAETLQQQGIYAWLSSLLVPYKPESFVDIGTGRGDGLMALVNQFPGLRQIVSVEENEECIDEAETALKNVCIGVNVNRRLLHLPSGNGHAIAQQTGKISLSGGVNIVAGDLLCDDELVGFLTAAPKFDAMTVWFVGTHYARTYCENLKPLKVKTSTEYRFHVQNKAYELADSILKHGGVLQIADRGEALDGGVGEAALRGSHEEQASVTSMRVVDLQHRRYEEAIAGQRVVMVASQGGKDVDATGVDTAVLSIISVKT